MGLEPARLGTSVFPSEPAGPFPIKIDLRTDGDYGIDSALIDIPKNLGGPQAVITQIETVLCAQVPCKATDSDRTRGTRGATPDPPVLPQSDLVQAGDGEAEREVVGDQPDHARRPARFTPTGCEAVPFDPTVSVTPTETDQAGAASGHRVTLEYPEYTDDPIWQANLKDADIALPEGMVLNPAGGYGLDNCSFEQFGVDPATGKQLNRAPHLCPEGSQIGTLTVTSPVLDFPLQGKAFFGPASGPGRPTPASPWKLFLLVEGAGLRVKLAGDLTVSEAGQLRICSTIIPSSRSRAWIWSPPGARTRVLRNPVDCGAHNGSASLAAGTARAARARRPLQPPAAPHQVLLVTGRRICSADRVKPLGRCIGHVERADPDRRGLRR